MDIAVMPSDFEGGPLALMEAMAAARPVVASDVGGIPELVDHGVHGLLVPPRDPPALAAAIAELLRDPARARAMGARGRERQRAEFAIEKTVAQLETLYEDLYAASGRGRRRAA